MRAKLEKWIWLRHVAVAVLYFAGYTALRHISFSYWFLPSGIRLLCLLLVPYRYWPALLAGEMISMGKLSYDCLETLGLSWSLLNLFPSIALAMPIVRWCRNRLGLLGIQHECPCSLHVSRFSYHSSTQLYPRLHHARREG